MAQILVVDDSRLIRFMVRSHLEVAGYQVIEAEDGLDALEKARKFKPDAILLDVIMPGLQGFEVLTMLKESPELAKIPVIMMTAETAEEKQIQGWKEGAIEYITKPFNPLTLCEVVQKVVDKKISIEATSQQRLEKLQVIKGLKDMRKSGDLNESQGK
jgi:DNA-binding response OmpR family regulator